MSWTRNYKNLIVAHALLTDYTNGISASSGWAFGDNCPLNVKASSGSVRDIQIGPSYNYGPSAGFFSLTGSGTLGGKSLYTQTVVPRTTIGTAANMGNSFSYNNFYIYFSTDDTAESVDDYTLSNVIVASANTNTVFTVTNNNNGTFTLSTNIVYTPAESGIIKSFGITKGMLAYYYSSSAYLMEVLLYRKVLAEPLTVTAGTPITISIQLTTPTITIS